MIITLLILLGLCFGSFVNALVWRLYQQSLPKKKRAAKDAELSISRGRSMCPHCKHTLAWYDLLPVVSWLWLRGECRYCKKQISWQYPIVELSTATVFVLSYVFWPLALNSVAPILVFVAWLIAIVAFMALTVYDIRWMLLPNRIVYPLIGLGAVKVMLVALAGGGLSSILNAGLALLIAGGIFYVLFQVSDGKWIGGGDVKLGFALGLLLGKPELAFLMLFLASFIGTLVALPGLMLKKTGRSSVLPFGPYLMIATVLAMLFGVDILRLAFSLSDAIVLRLLPY